jgi:hypothetical protein
MNEEEFDSLMERHSWGTKDAQRTEAQWRHRAKLAATLGAALWGNTLGDLRRQLLAPRPEIPSGFDLADLRELLVSTQTIAAALNNPRGSWLPPHLSLPAISIGHEHLTVWEARCAIVRRAIESLEDR